MEKGKTLAQNIVWGKLPNSGGIGDGKIYAVIELGANSVKTLTGKITGTDRIHVISHNRKITRLSEKLQSTGQLAENAMKRTLDCIKEFKTQAENAGAERIAVFGTHPLRVASNSMNFIDMVYKQTGLTTIVLSGEEEAFATRSGIMLNYDRKLGGEPLIIDIGGGSTEVVLGIRSKSVPIGCVNITESLISSDPPSDDEIVRVISGIRDCLIKELTFITPGKRLTCISVGGTAVSLAALHHEMKEYDSAKVQGTVITRRELKEKLEMLASVGLKQRKELLKFDPDRADVIIAGLIILDTFFRFIQMEEFTVSIFNIIHGVFYEQFSMCKPVQGE